MSSLTIYSEDAPDQGAHCATPARSAASWPPSACASSAGARRRAGAGAAPEDVLAAYREQIDRLVAERGYRSVDVVSLDPSHPERAALRAKFLAEHTHADDEVRFFVAGSGLFVLHAEGRVYAALCEQDDLISVPAGIRHWFDMGSSPAFTCIRLFNDPAGWVARFTGDDIATRFPTLA